MNTCSNIADCVDLAFSFFRSFLFRRCNIRPSQEREEITEFLQVLSRYKPETILEIGTANGGTLFLFAKISNPDAKLISMDLPNRYPENRMRLHKTFATNTQEIIILHQDSHTPKALHRVKNTLEGQMLDCLFIDGDHSYYGVKQDFNMYSPLVRKGGIIALHDICPSKLTRGVAKFWTEVRNKYKHAEIVKDLSQAGKGIGILYQR